LGSLSPEQAGKVTSKYIESVGQRSEKMSSDIDKKTEKYLASLQKREQKLQRKLAKIDSVAAHNIFLNANSQYEKLQADIRNKSANLLGGTGKYIPWLDTASNSLSFLNTNQLTSKLPVNPVQIQAAMGKVHDLENQLKQAENIKEFIRQRKEYLKQQLNSYNLGSGLKNYSKEGYYYTQQINEYRAALDDPSKMEQKAMALLRDLPVFQKFMNDHGFLAGLFNIPSDYAQGMGGLQTLSQIQGMMQDRMTSLGPNPQAMMQQSLSAAQSQLSDLRNKFPSMGEPGNMPEFKPNQEKTKTFLKRLTYGTNMQTVRGSYFFPLTSDIGLSVGYKINDKSTVGIGTSFKIGWGQDFSHVHVSGQGVGLRSFADIKLKGSFFGSGGFEYNYQTPFSSLQLSQIQKQGRNQLKREKI
jgi:hypothetical protein